MLPTSGAISPACLFLCLLAAAAVSLGGAAATDKQQPFRSRRSPAETIRDYEIIKPMVVSQMETDKSNKEQPHPKHLIVMLQTSQENFTLSLEKNEMLLAPSFASVHYDEDGKEIVTKGHPNCFYQGSVEGRPDLRVTMSTCKGMRGSFGDYSNPENHYNFEPYHESVLSLEDPLVFHLGTQFNQQEEATCGTPHGDHRIPKDLTKELGEGFVKDRFRKQTANGEYIVEWLMINDFRQIQAYSGNLEAAVMRNLDLTNAVDSLFRVLQVRVALVRVINWNNGDNIAVVSDSSQLLVNIRDYRPQITTQHDSLMLITGIDLIGSTVGVAYVGGMCSDRFSVGLTQDTGDNIDFVGAVTTHEVGHLFNMGHDDEQQSACACTDPTNVCIMQSFIGRPPAATWSTCSLNFLQVGFSDVGTGSCLGNEPSVTVGDPVCGNGLREGDETCDCGTPQECGSSSCCDPNTCRLRSTAQCGEGDCCDTSTCQFKAYGTTCRDSQECDIAEYCSGESENCPQDEIARNFLSCQGQRYCYDGSCTGNRNQQCRGFYGSAAAAGADVCYTTGNVQGEPYGHCGVTSTGYLPCDQSDVYCGSLYCDIALGTQFPSGATNPQALLYYTYANQCKTFTSQPGADFTNPGSVRDGTSCGTNQACFEQQCSAVSTLLGTSNCPTGNNGALCSGNGICNNRDTCSCNVGFTGADCSTGPGSTVPPPTQPTTPPPTQPPTQPPANTDRPTANPTRPPTLMPVVCGDGAVEGNEECDCGAQGCGSTSCCDGSTCRFKSYGTTCRPLVDQDCDIAEYCSGDSEACPQDDVLLDGTPCRRPNRGFCQAGECPAGDLNEQCQAVYGPDAAVGNSLCYEALNTRGQAYGHCGVTSNGYLPCGANDVKCGSLYCDYNLGTDLPTTNVPFSQLVFYSISGICKTFSTVPGSSYDNPGAVKDLSTCGDGNDMVCVGQECMDASTLLAIENCPADSGVWCSGNGECNNRQQCSCSVGYTGDACETFIDSSSSDQSSSSSSVMAVIGGSVVGGIVFLLVIAAIVIVVVLLLVSKSRKSSRSHSSTVDASSFTNGYRPVAVTETSFKQPTSSSNNYSAPPPAPRKAAPPPPTQTTPTRRPAPNPPPVSNQGSISAPLVSAAKPSSAQQPIQPVRPGFYKPPNTTFTGPVANGNHAYKAAPPATAAKPSAAANKPLLPPIAPPKPSTAAPSPGPDPTTTNKAPPPTSAKPSAPAAAASGGGYKPGPLLPPIKTPRKPYNPPE